MPRCSLPGHFGRFRRRARAKKTAKPAPAASSAARKADFSVMGAQHNGAAGKARGAIPFTLSTFAEGEVYSKAMPRILRRYPKIRGIWYLHEFTEVEVKTPVFLRGSFFRMKSEIQIISKSKRQLGKKQLKKLGLRNSSCGPGEVRSRRTWKTSSREAYS